MDMEQEPLVEPPRCVQLETFALLELVLHEVSHPSQTEQKNALVLHKVLALL